MNLFENMKSHCSLVFYCKEVICSLIYCFWLQNWRWKEEKVLFMWRLYNLTFQRKSWLLQASYYFKIKLSFEASKSFLFPTKRLFVVQVFCSKVFFSHNLSLSKLDNCYLKAPHFALFYKKKISKASHSAWLYKKK